MDKYTDLYNRMEFNKSYTSTELEVYPATMTAMAKRNLVRVEKGKPNHYFKIVNDGVKVLEKVRQICGKTDIEYFALFKKDVKIGMLCRFKGNDIVDCYDKKYDLSGVESIQLYQEKIKI